MGTAKERKGKAMNTDQIMLLCDHVRETAYAIHKYHGNGYLEKVYENALAHRLRKAGLDVKQQHQIIIYDEDGTAIGEYYADLFIENHLVVELKACRDTTNEHNAQLIHYLKGSRNEHGLLINFGSYKFSIQKFAKSDQPPKPSPAIKAILPRLALLAFFRG
jgi:GxxExxY protein